jgi:hypothetical protein
MLRLLRSLNLALVALAAIAFASTANATPLTVGGGWQHDIVSNTTDPSSLSPFDFTLAGDAVFSISDCCLVGDHYKVFNFGSLILETALGLLPTVWTPTGDFYDSEWTNPSLEHGQITLGPGTYELTVFGDCGGGCEAGVGERLDAAIPEPGTLALIAAGLIGTVAIRRRRAA